MIRICRTAAALVAGALMGAAALPAAAHEQQDHRRRHAKVAIAAIQYNSPGRDTRHDRSLNREWVRVVNEGRRTVQLDGYTLRDRDGHRYTFDRLRLRPGRGVVVHTGHGRDRRDNVYRDSHRHLYDNHRGSIALVNDHGRTEDTCWWGLRDHGFKRCDRR